jgi:hypothetical protein
MLTTSRNRIRTFATLVAALALAITGPGVVSANQGGVPAIPLNTEQETTGSNTGASGFFSYEIEGNQFCYTLTVRNLSGPAIGAHIHVGPRHVAGPIVIPLSVGSGTDWTVDTCTTADPALLEAVTENPRAYYVNVHTDLFPGGEIRGQLK